MEGEYLEADSESVEQVDGLEGNVQCLKFSCSVPAVAGRGFIEVIIYSAYSKIIHHTRQHLLSMVQQVSVSWNTT